MVVHSGGPSSISKLNHDIFFEIFYINAAGDPPNELKFNKDAAIMNPLVITLKTSHVCKEWYTIILQSPSIWARCFNLDALWQRESDTWRRLVLERTGDSLLSVAGTRYIPFDCGAKDFLLHLVRQHWSRIRDFNVNLAGLDPDWEDVVPQIIAIFARPTEVLETFVIRFGLEGISRTGPTRTPNRSTMFDAPFLLFSNHAPSLVHLSIETQIVPIQFTKNFTLSVNMRHLKLTHHALDIADTDLLSVFMQMPQLEYVNISIYKLDIKSGSNFLRPSLPRLKRFQLDSMDFDVYPGFLDRIDPGWECEFFFMHHIREWTVTALEEETWSEISRSMRHVTEHYTHHLFTQSKLHPPDDVVDVEMELRGSYHVQFACIKRCMVISVLIHDNTARDVMVHRLLDTFGAIDLPNPVTQLRLSLPKDFLIECPFVKEGLKLPHTITNFIGTSAEISYIRAIAGGSATGTPVFPLLKTLSISPSENLGSDTQVYQTTIPFILDRQRAAAPIENLVFLQWDENMKLKENRKPDLHAFDQFVGLKVIWYKRGIRYEHVCSDID